MLQTLSSNSIADTGSFWAMGGYVLRVTPKFSRLTPNGSITDTNAIIISENILFFRCFLFPKPRKKNCPPGANPHNYLILSVDTTFDFVQQAWIRHIQNAIFDFKHTILLDNLHPAFGFLLEYPHEKHCNQHEQYLRNLIQQKYLLLQIR